MLKVVIQILIVTFILVLCYDTIDICLNQINSKKGSELLIVKHEIEEKQQVESITPYENDLPVWPIILGFSCVFGSVLCHFILPLSCLSWKRRGSKDDPYQSLTKVNRNYKKEKEEFCYEKNNGKDDSKHCFDIRIKDELVYHEDLGLITRQDLSARNDSKIGSFTQFTTGQETPVMNICIPKLFHDDKFPAQSSIVPISNVSLSSSLTSLEHLDCSNSKNICSMRLENNNISKMELPITHRSYYEEENRLKKHVSRSYCKKNCEILSINNAFFEEQPCHGNENSNESISIHQGQIMGLFPMSNSTDGIKPQITTSDKSINVQLLTFNDSDIKKIQKKLENIEIGLRRSEEKTKDWGKRINVAETELVDLHEQMYTIYSKFEEEKKTNYIIVSKVSKDKIFPRQKELFDTLAEELNGQDEEKRDDEYSKSKMEEEEESSLKPVSDLCAQKDSNDDSSVVEEHSENDKTNDEDSQQAIEDFSEVMLTELKQRSVGLEAHLERKSRVLSNSHFPKRKLPQINVPPHILPPYKRSSFAGTDSKADIRKGKLHMKTHKGGKEFFWRTRI